MTADHSPPGAAHVDHRGRRYVLGRTAEAYAIWDGAAGGSAVELFPLSVEGWTGAWERFQAMEAAADRTPVPRAAPYPLTVGQIVGGALRVWVRHFWSLAGMTAILVIPAHAILLPLTLTSVRFERTIGGIQPVVPLWVDLVSNVVYAVVYTLAAAAAVRAGVLTLQGRRPSVGDSLRAAARRAPTLALVALATTILVAVAIFPGAFLYGLWAEDGTNGLAVAAAIVILAGVALGVFLAVRLLLAAAAAVVEGRRGLAPVGRSWTLVRGLTWRTLGAILLAGLVILAAALVLFAVIFAAFVTSAGPGTEDLFRSVILWTGVTSAILLSATLPFANLVIALLYVDARVRKEGLDLDTLARETGAAS